jgi:ankyrin repeat protein
MAASIGDLNSIILLESKGIDLNSYDYDKRTALHLACSECHLNVVEYLIKKKVNIDNMDRWSNKALDDIKRYRKTLKNDDTPIYKSLLMKSDNIIELLTNGTTKT